MVAQSPVSPVYSHTWPQLYSCWRHVSPGSHWWFFWWCGKPGFCLHLCPLVTWKSRYFPNFLSRPLALD